MEEGYSVSVVAGPVNIRHEYIGRHVPSAAGYDGIVNFAASKSSSAHDSSGTEMLSSTAGDGQSAESQAQTLTAYVCMRVETRTVV